MIKRLHCGKQKIKRKRKLTSMYTIKKIISKSMEKKLKQNILDWYKWLKRKKNNKSTWKLGIVFIKILKR